VEKSKKSNITMQFFNLLMVSKYSEHSLLKSPLAPLCQRGEMLPLGKGRSGGILKNNVHTIMRLFMIFGL
jgi:hypothetical protein